MTSIPSLPLNDGRTIPQVGFGIWEVDPNGAADAVASAFETGYRLIDGAFIYGNEAGLGEGFRRSGLARDEVFITTKIWNRDQGRPAARASVERSLEAMGLDYLDLVLIHWPYPMADLYLETWEAMIEMREIGLMRSIGVSNFNADHLERIVAATGVVPALNQIEINPELQQPAMRAVNASHGIVTQSWTPLGNGRSFDSPVMKEIAARVGKSVAQVTLRWHIEIGHSVIPRSVKPARQAENLDLFDFELTPEDMAAIETLNMGLRTGPDPSVFCIP
ncbi:MAG: aldo/keto reductase [Pseudomonadota bacterium]